MPPSAGEGETERDKKRKHRRKHRHSSSEEDLDRGSGERNKHKEKGRKRRERKGGSESESEGKSEERRGRRSKRKERHPSPHRKSSQELRREGPGDVETGLQRMMRDYPLDVLHDFLQLLERVDEGTAADISGIPDNSLRRLLKGLFGSLGLTCSASGSIDKSKKKEKTKEKEKGHRAYGLPAGHPPTLPIVAPLVSRLLAEAASPSGQSDRPAGPLGAAARSTAAVSPEAAAAAAAGTRAETQGEGATDGEGELAGAGSTWGGQGPGDAPISKEDAEECPSAVGDKARAAASDERTGPPSRRVVGPAMPTAQQLEAAARLTAATEALRQAEAALEDNSPLVGPPPPAVIAEASSATEAMRVDQVTRLLRPDITPYEVLELEKACSASEIKKSYWKLSLLVHPDKCPHPQAAEAFQVLNSALKALSDPDKRASIDAKLEAAAEQKAFEVEMKVLREAAEWRRIRGTPEPGDEELLKPSAGGSRRGLAREEWMTELPPERQAARAPQQNIFFSKTEKTGRGDTSAWTDTPQQRAEKARKHFLEAQTQAALAGPETEQLRQRAEAAEAAAREAEPTADAGWRQESLVEQHRKKLLKEEKKKKKAKKEGGQGAEEWRMWDRERDLEIKPKSMTWTKNEMAGGLANRFGSSGGSSYL